MFLHAAPSFGVSPANLSKEERQQSQENCNQKNIAAHCFSLGEEASNRGQLVDAKSWYRKACNLGIADACTASGKIWLILGDENQALRDLNRACTMPASDGSACFHIGELAALKQGPKNAKNWYAKACRKGYNPACK